MAPARQQVPAAQGTLEYAVRELHDRPSRGTTYRREPPQDQQPSAAQRQSHTACTDNAFASRRMANRHHRGPGSQSLFGIEPSSGARLAALALQADPGFAAYFQSEVCPSLRSGGAPRPDHREQRYMVVILQRIRSCPALWITAVRQRAGVEDVAAAMHRSLECKDNATPQIARQVW